MNIEFSHRSELNQYQKLVKIVWPKGLLFKKKLIRLDNPEIDHF